MSELKATTAQEIVRNEKDCDYMDELFGGVKMPPTQVYLKSEADKVIDELKQKINEAQTELELWRDGSIISELHQKELDEKRHSDYKRCLAMASWCCDACDKWMMRKAKAIGLGKDGVKEYHQARSKLFLYMRWQMRWLKIAEQFKEAK